MHRNRNAVHDQLMRAAIASLVLLQACAVDTDAPGQEPAPEQHEDGGLSSERGHANRLPGVARHSDRRAELADADSGADDAGSEAERDAAIDAGPALTYSWFCSAHAPSEGIDFTYSRSVGADGQFIECTAMGTINMSKFWRQEDRRCELGAFTLDGKLAIRSDGKVVAEFSCFCSSGDCPTEE